MRSSSIGIAVLALFIATIPLSAAPTLTSLSVTSSYPPCAPFDITITGTGFLGVASASLGGSPLATTFVSATELTATVTSADLATPGSVSVIVTQSDEGDSNSLPFTIGNTPLDSMSPDMAETGSGDVLLTVTGSCYESGAEILWLGAPKTTTFVNATTLTATIPASDFLAPGEASVRVRNANGNVSGVLYFSIDQAEPTVSSVTPSSSYPPCAPFGITVSGQDFTVSDEIVFDDTYLSTTFVNSTTLTATLTSANLASPGSVSVYVDRPEVATSNSVPFTISRTPFDNFSPDSVDAGSGDTLVTVTGSCYEAGAAILWNGSPLPTTFVNSTTLTVTVPAANFASAGSASISVSNANGNTSLSEFFSIPNPGPVVTSISPTSSYPPCAPFDITVSGQDFTINDEIVFDGAYPSTTFVNSTTLTATLNSAALGSPGSVSVYVDRSEVATSNSVPFTISQTPLDSLSPSSTAAGSNATVLTVTGSCYESGATILWNGAPLTTTFVSATTLTATIPAPNLASPGSASVTVSNANGNTSAALTFTIGTPPPVLSSISPTASYPPCAPFTITVKGQDFIEVDDVVLAGSNLQTTFVGSTTLTAMVTSSDLSSPGVTSLHVKRYFEDSGFTTSNSVPFTVSATPLDSMTPNTAVAGSGATVLTVTGSCYESGATILWNGAPLTTTFVNATTLTATIPAPNLASPGSASVTVSNANGNTSAPLAFTVGDPPPALTSISPTSSYTPCAPFSLTAIGSGFSAASTIVFGGSPLATSFVSATELSAAVSSAQLDSSGSKSVAVSKPTHPDTASLPFTVRATPLVSMSPTSATAGASATQLTVTGNCYEAGATILWNGSPLATTFINATTLRTTIPAPNLASTGVAQVSVRNANGNASAPLTFTIGQATPVITSVSPPQAMAGSGPITVSIMGSKFQSMAEVLLNQVSLSPSAVQWVNMGLIRITVPASLLAVPGGLNVEVRNPSQITSNAASLQILIAPFVERVQPNSGPPPCAPFDIVVEGQNLPFDGQVILGGVPLATTPGNGAQLIATVTSAALATPGSVPLVVRRANQPDTAPFPFLVHPTPLSSLAPSSSAVGGPALSIEVKGGCFEQGAVILWNGAPLPTTFTDSTTLDAIVPATNFAAPGTASVSVRNPNGNTSVTFPFRIGPVPGGSLPPVISSLAPDMAVADPMPLTVGINGRDFGSQALVIVDGVAIPKQDVRWFDPGRITFALPGAARTEARILTIEVENPDGVRSNPMQFRVLPIITGINPQTWIVGRPCDLFIAGRGFTDKSAVVVEGPAGTQRLTPTAPPELNQITACLPPVLVATPGTILIRVCNTVSDQEVCSAPITLEITGGLSITGLRPMSAPAGSGALCLAVDIEAVQGDPGALVARWDGADLPNGAPACPAEAGLWPEMREIGQGVFATTILAQVDAARLAVERPRNTALPCSADPVAPRITAFATSLQTESAPACFDITALTPTLQPPALELREDGCVSVLIPGESIHVSAEVVVEGLESGFCSGGEPMVTGCGLGGADSSICTQIGFAVPAGSGVLTVSIRNPAAVCSTCMNQSFSVNVDQVDQTLRLDEVSVGCSNESASFARTSVGAQSRLACEISNNSDSPGRLGELSVAEPFSVASSTCVDAILRPGETCSADLLFSPVRVGLFAAGLLSDGESVGEPQFRLRGVGILRSAILSIVDGATLTPGGQSAVRIQTDGAAGLNVRVLLRQTLRIDPQVSAFPIGAGSPQIDCGFPAAVVGVEYSQPLVAACGTSSASWEITPIDGGVWASATGDTISGTPNQPGVFRFELRLNSGFPQQPAPIRRTCEIRVAESSGEGGDVPAGEVFLPCTLAQFADGGARVNPTLNGDSPLDVEFAAGTLAGLLRFVAVFEYDGVDVSPELSPTEATASVVRQAPVVTSATFSCPTSGQMVVDVIGSSSTREISSLRFAFQPAAGATTTLELSGDAATRPDLVGAFQTRYSQGSSSNDLDGGFSLRAVFTVSGRAADIGGVGLTLQNAAGSTAATATAGQPACSQAQ